MNIFGGFDLKLDSKGRVGLPPNFRKELGSHVIITDWIGKCISIYSIESWAEVYDKLNRSSKESVNGNDVKRCILAHAYSVEVDPEGRIHIPECLSSRVNIVRDVRVNGNGNRVEVWDQSTWKEYEGLSPTAECMTVCGEAAMLREKILHKLKEDASGRDARGLR